MNKKKLHLMTQAALIAAVYVVLTMVFAPFSFSEIQVRIAEALTILPLFTPAAIPGLFIGCLLGNILGGAALPDIIFGSLATLIGAYGTWMLRNAKPFLAPLPPILSNVAIIPFVLRFAYGINLPIPFMMLTVGIGEVLSCGVLGLLLYYALQKYKNIIFRQDSL
ncbi:QueT transporter family protein [Eubacterium sp. AB3007]|uniref:QueT transporter family protein n=1 Tax=Eubacterium sp. AB3007 TaxID=1392487 RepID=UPI0004881FCC|nr:QueT transporter family protein [Eubacterium sp. AB3007]